MERANVYVTQDAGVAQDLAPQAVLLARRIQALAEDRAYAFAFGGGFR